MRVGAKLGSIIIYYLITSSFKQILNCAIDYTDFKSIAFVSIPFLTQPDTDNLGTRFIE